MKRSSRAWLLLPIVIIMIAVVGLVLSNFQKEVGIAEPFKAGRAAVAAAVQARDLALGSGPGGYTAFSEALLVATVARRNAPLINPADTRLDHLLGRALDCLAAAREAWQAEIDQAWDPDSHGVPAYWNALHPSLAISRSGPLAAGDVRELATARATQFLADASKLAD